jgi:hypothetical protein
MTHKYVLVLCQADEPIVRSKLTIIAQKALKNKNIILEFMSNPRISPAKLNSTGKPYQVTYNMIFDESHPKFLEFIINHTNYYSLIIMNTCAFPFAPDLSTLVILDGLKEILRSNGLLMISFLNYLGELSNSNISNKKRLIKIFEPRLSQINHDNIFPNFFEKIDIDDNGAVE